MAEESKKTENTRVNLSLTSDLKKNLDSRAKQIGVPTTQYIVSLIIEDMKKHTKSTD